MFLSAKSQCMLSADSELIVWFAYSGVHLVDVHYSRGPFGPGQANERLRPADPVSRHGRVRGVAAGGGRVRRHGLVLGAVPHGGLLLPGGRREFPPGAVPAPPAAAAPAAQRRELVRRLPQPHIRDGGGIRGGRHPDGTSPTHLRIRYSVIVDTNHGGSLENLWEALKQRLR